MRNIRDVAKTFMKFIARSAGTVCLVLGMALAWGNAMEARAEVTATGGTFGVNNGLSWVMDEETKTITVTGEDECTLKYSLAKVSIFNANAEHIRFENCVLKGRIGGFFCSLSKLRDISFAGADTSQVTDMSGMFSGCSSLVSVDTSGLSTSNVTDMNHMFYGCGNLVSVDVSGWDTSQVTNMLCMFRGCGGLESVDTSGWNTSQVTNMSGMFSNCRNLADVDTSEWDTSHVKNMRYMFSSCSSLVNVATRDWDTSAVKNMSAMFYGCGNLESLDMAGWNLAPVTSADLMFEGCAALQRIKVPAVIREITPDLPGVFTYLDDSGTQQETSILSAVCVGKELTRKGAQEQKEITLNSFGDEADSVTIQIFDASGAVIGEATLTGNSASYTLPDSATGTFTMRLSKKNHVPRDYTITVGEALPQDMELHLIGDVTGDGKVTAIDSKLLYNHIKGAEGAELTDYDLAVGDVSGDGKITSIDKKMLYNHIKNQEQASLWE